MKNLSDDTLSTPHLRTETDPVFETLFSLDKVQNPSNPKCSAPSSEPFRSQQCIRFPSDFLSLCSFRFPGRALLWGFPY
jgi:hypothetical protein